MINVEQMLAKLDVAISECLIIPNEWLPTEYHDDVRGGRTIARLEQECDVREGLSEHVKLKAIKARNIEGLRKQVEEKSIFTTHAGGTDFVDLDGELDYSDNETDEIQLHKNMMALVGGMVNSGMIDAEDLEEE